MLTMAENVIATGVDNRPLILDKKPENIHEACDIRATNIVLQGLPQDFYNLVNHHTEAKEIWDRVKLLIKGSELSLQERESKLYDEFDTFTLEKGETIHSYYLRFVKLINDMHTIGMSMQLLQVNTKFVDHLQPEWRKFVTDVKHLSKTVELQYRQFRGDRLRGMQAVEQGVMLQPQRLTKIGELIQHVRQRLFVATTVKRMATWQDTPSASTVLMAKLSAYDLDVLSEVPNPNTYETNNVIDLSVQDMQYSEQPPFINNSDIDITNDSNVISYEQYLQETENEVIQDTNSSAQQDAMIISVIEETSNQVAKYNEVNKENKTLNESLTAELERYKEL
ncbi:hypothetical protein Tco_0751560 [Tanacetum coccineum]|uniref:Integrase, catalytic region, zinc finger, CCHC-type, peptidase aspartic, catalytic n=1 Tax=Tanacetum coccineum TaxID=301880 RepID=A0ABQ4Z4D1_9ASTR